MSSEMPEGWREGPLGEQCRIEIGGTPSRDKPQFWSSAEEGYPWASIADLKTSRVDCTKEFISELGVKNSNVKLVPRGTVMMSFKLTIGRTAWADRDLYTNEAIAAFFPGKDIDNEFLFYALPAAAGRADTDQAIKGVTLNKEKLRSLRLRLPPLDEQRRIAEVMRSVDVAIAAAESSLGQGHVTQSALLDSAFCSGEPIALGNICALIYRYPGFYGFEQREAGVPVIRGEHLRAGRISTDWSNFYFVDPGFSQQFPKTILGLGDVVMSVRGTVGTAAVVDAAHVGSQISPNLIRLVADPKRILPQLLFFAVQSAVARIRKTIVNAQALPSINAGDLKMIEIAVPPMDDQPALLSELESVNAATEEAARALRHALEVKRLLASDLLSGRVRVPA